MLGLYVRLGTVWWSLFIFCHCLLFSKASKKIYA